MISGDRIIKTLSGRWKAKEAIAKQLMSFHLHKD